MINVYFTILSYIRYSLLLNINHDSKYIYSINEADETLVVEYPQGNESGQETFYFGPWISKIVDEKRGVIDFSKLDELYQLI